jgi:hypothetical protein
MTRILFQAAVVLFGIVVGCATGGYLTFHRYARDYQIVRAFAWTGIFSAVSENQYDQNTTDAKKELQVLLDIFKQETNSTAIDGMMRNAFLMNGGLVEARLSVLEKEAGNVELSKTYLSKAQEDLKAAGWIDYSESNILQAVKRKPVVPCGTAPQTTAKTNTTSKPCG